MSRSPWQTEYHFRGFLGAGRLATVLRPPPLSQEQCGPQWPRAQGAGRCSDAQATSSPLIVPLPVAKESISSPTCWAKLTNNFGSG